MGMLVFGPGSPCLHCQSIRLILLMLGRLSVLVAQPLLAEALSRLFCVYASD